MRTGAEYLKSLDDGRTVILDGAVVDNVAEHPAFAPMAKTIAELLDIANDESNGMQYTAPETGATANRTFSIPRSHDDLVARRKAIETWALHTHGWVGRSPDHVGTFLASYAANPQVFDVQDSPHDFAANVAAFSRRLLNETLSLSYAIIPPQGLAGHHGLGMGGRVLAGRRGRGDRRGPDH